MKEKKFTINDFEIGYPLGRGKFGRVYVARTKKEKFIVAIKVLYKEYLRKHNMSHQLRREIEIQTRLQHKNIIQMYTYFWDENSIYIVLEYAPKGELYNRLKRSGRFDDLTAAKYTLDIIQALMYCHQNNVIHRDLKPENILIGYDGSLKLADFGWSVHALSEKRKTMCGTIDYLPPEMVKHKSHDHNADIWCLGVLAYEFLAGKPPFDDKNINKTYQKIIAVQYEFPEYFSEESRDFISNLLVEKPKNRLPLKFALVHPWIAKANPGKN